jgi:NAD(P)-dependent dehydrogenase (short-subunit alcohol dehydrogenase family)
MDVRDKVAIVTGAGSGIGRATALRLAREGAQVVVAEIDEPTGPETAAMIAADGGEARFLKVDVGDEADIREMIAFAERVFGGLDILHNNAGVSTAFAGFEGTSSASWLRTLDINLRGVLLGTYHALPALRRQGGGAVVNTASGASLTPLPGDPVYAATKAGVLNFTRSLAYLSEEANIRVNCVCPGLVATNIRQNSLAPLSQAERAASEGPWQTLLRLFAGRELLRPEDIAEAVMRLIADGRLAGKAYLVPNVGEWEVV